MLSVIILNVIMLSVIILNVFMLSVVAQSWQYIFALFICTLQFLCGTQNKVIR
jgi:hypothetical protein